MYAENFQLESYLKRIGYSGSLEHCADTLTKLMRAQLFSVAFENLEFAGVGGMDKLLHLRVCEVGQQRT